MKIEWTKTSVDDLENLRNYIAKDSEYYASLFLGKIIASVEQLAKFPKIGRKVPEVEDENIRELIFHNYRIIYLVEKTRILVLTIVHSGRDLTQKEPNSWEIV